MRGFHGAKLPFMELFAQWEELVRLMHSVNICVTMLSMCDNSHSLPANLCQEMEQF